ncbi:alanine dehydrogenase, partial [Pantoea sp. SIMBA_133]
MHIGIPVEVKNNENRVAMTPAGVLSLTSFGHEVYIEQGAGVGAGFEDEQYLEAGAHLVETAAEAWSKEM